MKLPKMLIDQLKTSPDVALGLALVDTGLFTKKSEIAAILTIPEDRNAMCVAFKEVRMAGRFGDYTDACVDAARSIVVAIPKDDEMVEVETLNFAGISSRLDELKLLLPLPSGKGKNQPPDLTAGEFNRGE